MREVVIIGGGLSGLAAAWELAQRRIPHTLIEVKNRLGGAIISQAQADFVLDGGPLFVPRAADWAFLDELDLSNALVAVDDTRAVFRQGTQTLVDALAKRLSAPPMKRMAVSSLGTLAPGVFGVCLENGILLDTRALMIAAPARYAERMLRELQGDIALRLLDFRYDTILRLSLGIHATDMPAPVSDDPIAFIDHTTAPERVPPDKALLQIGLRIRPDALPADPLAALAARLHWKAQILAQRVDFWPEADLVRDAPVLEHLAAIPALLPPGVALIGSDYLAQDSLSARVWAARAAAQRIAAYLGK
ncbi:MAG: NAD(P)-binding protein [Chloroflexi bacterium]|nr:NAD(P)-binding protein [Chloroflexota bacterium]